MEIVNIWSRQLFDTISSELSFLVIGVADNSVGIGMSQESCGEAEIFMTIDECKTLIDSLNKALTTAKTIHKGHS